MSETHTPGPWTVDVNGYGGFDIKAKAPEGHDMVLCQRSNWPGRDLMSIANGFLIAAAPDLLAACKRGRQKLATYQGVFAGDSELEHLLVAWDAAIAKAEGRS